MSIWHKFGEPDIMDFGSKFLDELKFDQTFGLLLTFWKQYHMKYVDFLKDQAILLNFEFILAYKELKQKLDVPQVSLYLEDI